MNKPFAVVVADRGGHWDEWLVGASSKEEATEFVRSHFGLHGRKVTAYDMTVEEELQHTSGIYGVPRVVDHSRPHFLPVPAMSGLHSQLKHQVVLPAVEGTRNRAQNPTKRKKRGKPVGARTMNRKPQVREVDPKAGVEPDPPQATVPERVPELKKATRPRKKKASAEVVLEIPEIVPKVLKLPE